MRITTTLEVLRRGINGHRPTDIAASMHMGRTTVAEILDKAGWPDLGAVATWRDQYKRGAHRETYAVAELAAQLAKTIRLNPAWVHQHTEGMEHQQLRELVSVMAALLDEEIDVRDALAWADTGGKPGRPKKVRETTGEDEVAA